MFAAVLSFIIAECRGEATKTRVSRRRGGSAMEANSLLSASVPDAGQSPLWATAGCDASPPFQRSGGLGGNKWNRQKRENRSFCIGAGNFRRWNAEDGMHHRHRTGTTPKSPRERTRTSRATSCQMPFVITVPHKNLVY